MQHRIPLPFLLHPGNGKTLEQLLSPFEISLESRKQQALAETARTAQEIGLAQIGYSPHKSRLVHIKIILFANLRKGLYPDRKLTQ